MFSFHSQFLFFLVVEAIQTKIWLFHMKNVTSGLCTRKKGSAVSFPFITEAVAEDTCRFRKNYLTNCMEYTQVKMCLKSGILASIWYCKLQGFQISQWLYPLDPHQGSALELLGPYTGWPLSWKSEKSQEK